MTDQFSYQYPPHSHYRSEHVQLPMARSTSDFASPPQQHASPYYSESDPDAKEFGSPYSQKAQPFDAGYVSPPQPVYPMLHKDVSFASDHSDARSMATSRYPTFNTPPQQVQEKPPRFWHKILPNSMACRLYLLTVLIETIVDIAIEVDLLVLVTDVAKEASKSKTAASSQPDRKVARLPVYLVVFGLAHLFQLALALDAVHAQNTLQFLFLAVFNALLLAYAFVQKTEIRASLDPQIPGMANIPVDALTAIIIAVICLSQVAYIALGYKIYTEFGWKVYKLLGADRGIKRMFMHLQVFLCLTKFDVFFFVGFGVQWIFLVLEPMEIVDFEYYLTIAALPLSIVVLFLGHRAAHKENKWLMGAFIAGSTAACVYFVYKFWKIFADRKQPTIEAVFKSLTIFSVLSIVLLVTTFAWAIIVMHNFGQGLKGRVSKHKKGASMAFSSRTGRRGSQFEMGTHPHRLSID